MQSEWHFDWLHAICWLLWVPAAASAFEGRCPDGSKPEYLRVCLKGRVNRLGLRQKFSKEEAQDATEAVEAIVKSERALGHVILSAGYNGEIKASPAAGPACKSRRCMLTAC